MTYKYVTAKHQLIEVAMITTKWNICVTCISRSSSITYDNNKAFWADSSTRQPHTFEWKPRVDCWAARDVRVWTLYLLLRERLKSSKSRTPPNCQTKTNNPKLYTTRTGKSNFESSQRTRDFMLDGNLVVETNSKLEHFRTVHSWSLRRCSSVAMQVECQGTT